MTVEIVSKTCDTSPAGIGGYLQQYSMKYRYNGYVYRCPMRMEYWETLDLGPHIIKIKGGLEEAIPLEKVNDEKFGL